MWLIFNYMIFSKHMYILGLMYLIPSLHAYTNPAIIDSEDAINTVDVDSSFGSCQKRNSTYIKCCVKYDILICLEAQYLPVDIGVKVALFINNKEIWSETISETSPPEICPFDVPKVAEVCLKVYDLQIKQSHFCLNMTVKLDIAPVKIPFKKIHIACFDWTKELPKPLEDCAISNVTDTSFGLKCKHESNRKELYLLEVVNSIDVVKNKTHSTPDFVISDLSPGTHYFGFVFTQNKNGYSQPIEFNITTKERPVLGRVMANAVVNVYTMYILLFVFTVATLAIVVNIVVQRIYLNRNETKTFAQIKDDLAHKLLPENCEKSCSNITYE